MTISPVTQNTFSSAISLLKKNKLPTGDITDASPLFVLTDANELIGTVGLELYGNYALLRSLCVDDGRRNSGAGETLISFVETFAKNNGVKELYLLTTTADEYFKAKGYEVADRNKVPEEIKRTTEFASVCPTTAVVMKKILV